MRSEVGERVFAVRNADATTVYLFGFGVYEGDFPRPGSGSLTGRWSDDEWAIARDAVAHPVEFDPGPYYDHLVAEGKMTRAAADDAVAAGLARVAAANARPVEERVVELLRRLDLNPRIRLDDGRHVWGFESWWGPEAAFDTHVRRGRSVAGVEPGFPDS